MIKRNKTIQREVTKKNQTTRGKENGDGNANKFMGQASLKERDQKSMGCEQSTMVLTDKTNNQSKMLTQNQSALANFESLTLEQPKVDAFFLRQEKQDREEDLKQFHPDLANMLI